MSKRGTGAKVTTIENFERDLERARNGGRPPEEKPTLAESLKTAFSDMVNGHAQEKKLWERAGSALWEEFNKLQQHLSDGPHAPDTQEQLESRKADVQKHQDRLQKRGLTGLVTAYVALHKYGPPQIS